MKIKKTKGYTLIELIIVIFLIAVIGMISTEIFIFNIRTQKRSEKVKELKQTGDGALLVMSEMIKNSIDLDCTGSNNEYIRFKNYDGLTTTFACIEDSGMVKIASQSGDFNYSLIPGSDVYLTPDDYQVTGCNFTAVCPASRFIAKYAYLFFNLGFQEGSSLYDASVQEFQTTVSLRQYN